MNLFRKLLSLLATLAIAACGGGGGDAGTPVLGGGSGSGSVAVSDLVVVLSNASIANTGSESSTLTVTAVDANRKALSGVPVTVSADANAVVRTSAAATGTDGSLTATVSIGSDLSPRTITVTASTGAITRSVSLVVTNVVSSLLPSLGLEMSSTTISAASPATVTALLRDGKGVPIPGQVVSFSAVRGLAVTNAPTALTGPDGRAAVVLSPASPGAVGADEIAATASVGGSALQASRGFQVQATDVSISGFSAAVASLSAYGQTSMTVSLSGVSLGSPVQLGVTSSCVALGKATVSPSSFTATSTSFTLQYQDNGCGAVQSSDQLQVSIVGSTASRSLVLPIAAPSASSIGFVKAEPEVIYLKGTGLTESSQVTFVVRDAAGNPLPNRAVVTQLLAPSGGATLEGGNVAVTRESDANGRVSVRINSGTIPLPIRVSATLQGAGIATVSSNLSVAVGLPSQLNFSLSQGTRNIEGMTLDGTPNTYTVIASDRNGNPVPAGTSINFITEGGQVQAVRQIQTVNGMSVATANFLSSEPRPADGRVTVTAYALGEESFIDLNGNNVYDKDIGEPFQDLGNIFKDRNFDGLFDPATDEFVPLPALPNGLATACTAAASPLLALNASIPSVPGTCSGSWSGAGAVYVRRALETVFSTSVARPLWPVGEQSAYLCARPGALTLQVSSSASQSFEVVGGSTWYGGKTGTIQFLASDDNGVRLNPVAAGTAISVVASKGLTASVDGGSPVPSTDEATRAFVSYGFDDQTKSGELTISFKSPGGVVSSTLITVKLADKPAVCPQ